MALATMTKWAIYVSNCNIIKTPDEQDDVFKEPMNENISTCSGLFLEMYDIYSNCELVI